MLHHRQGGAHRPPRAWCAPDYGSLGSRVGDRLRGAAASRRCPSKRRWCWCGKIPVLTASRTRPARRSRTWTCAAKRGRPMSSCSSMSTQPTNTLGAAGRCGPDSWLPRPRAHQTSVRHNKKFLRRWETEVPLGDSQNPDIAVSYESRDCQVSGPGIRPRSGARGGGQCLENIPVLLLRGRDRRADRGKIPSAVFGAEAAGYLCRSFVVRPFPFCQVVGEGHPRIGEEAEPVPLTGD